MDRSDVARALDEIAKYVELSEPNRFKALAFERAAKAVTSRDRDLEELIASRDLYKTAGIGERTGAVIEELFRSGRSPYLDELRKQFPPGIFEMLRVPGLGLKKIGILFHKLGIGSLNEGGAGEPGQSSHHLAWIRCEDAAKDSRRHRETPPQRITIPSPRR